jgi:hypothetical protein
MRRLPAAMMQEPKYGGQGGSRGTYGTLVQSEPL